MPSTRDEREFGIASNISPKSTRLDVKLSAAFDTPTAPLQVRFLDRSPSDSADNTQHEIRVLAGSALNQIALIVGIRLRGRTIAPGFTQSADRVSRIDPPPVDDDPRFPRVHEQSATRFWTVTAFGGANVAQHIVVLEVRCDAQLGHSVAQRVVTRNDDRLELAYVLSEGTREVATGSIQLDAAAIAEGGLQLGPLVVIDDLD